MTQKKNWINKKYGVIGGSLLLLILCFELAFKNSFEAYQTNQNLKAQLSQTSELSYQPGYLHRKEQNLDAILSHYRSDSSALRGNTIANLSRLAEKGNVKLSEVPVEDPVFHTDQYIIERLKFVGDFKSLVKTLDYWEVSEGMGISRSIVMKTLKSDEPANQKIVMEVLLEISK
jgi:hypothetical protein